MPVEIHITEHDDLETLKLEVGDKWRGTLVDIDEAPHYAFGTQEPEYQRDGRPKSKWVARLRPKGATDNTGDLKWWTQNQVKFALREAISACPDNYAGADIGIERMPDGEPRKKAYKGPANYRIVIITAGPDGWVDPFATADSDGAIEDQGAPF